MVEFQVGGLKMLVTADGLRPSRRWRRSRRRGSTVILAAFCLVIMLVFAVFAVDVGYMCLVRTQAQAASDAAAMAAAWELLDERRLGDYSLQEELANEARDVAVGYAARNRVSGGKGPALDHNPSNHPNGNLVFGRLNNSGDISTVGNLREHNAVFVRAGRTEDRGGAAGLFFARCLGFDSADITAVAIATFRDGVSGFRPTPRTGNTTLIPFAVDVDIWRRLIARQLGTDDWTVDPQANQVAAGGDGILELNFYPNDTGSAGNFGTLEIGDPNNGIPEIAGQIVTGISEADLAFEGGEFGIGSCPGDPGISGGIKHALAQIIGKPCSIALYDSVSGTGNNSVYNIVGFAGIRVVDFWLEDTVSDRVVLQPSVVVDDSAIGDGGSSYSIYQPVVLAK
jgi:hypothetical protein